MSRGHVCKPIKSVRDLLETPQNPISWWPLVEPLQPRSVAYRLNDKFGDLLAADSKLMVSDRRAQTMVCHDFKGNYHTDKFVTGGTKFDDYRFYNWAACDVFCYFSHYFVTVPTLQWLNAAHKHGVRVLGTFIVESRAGHRRLNEEVLVSVETARQVADAMVSICEQCKFEGWLINIECTVDEKNIPVLMDFLDYLTKQTRQRIPKGSIVWYDSVVKDGVLSWQNELNENNRMFFEVCDAIFLNYTWTEHHLNRSKDIIARYYPGRRHDIFVGIDVFGRGQLAKMDSHTTLAKIRNEDFSVAFFAPGWTLESLQPNVDIEVENGTDMCNLRFLERNEAFWKTLWPYLSTTSVHSIPFSTSFCLGSGKFENRLGRMVYYGPWFNLAKQELQISVPGVSRSYEDAFNGGSCLKLHFDSRTPDLEHRLFVSDFDCSHDLLVAFAIKRNDRAIDMELVLIVSDKTTDDRRVKLVCVGNESAHKRRDKTDHMGQQEIRIRALDKQVVRELTMHVQYRRECHLPAFDEINGWEIRHYYVAFARSRRQEIKLTDIGVRMRRVRRSAEDTDIESSLLLGSLAINKGVPPDMVELSDALYPKVSKTNANIKQSHYFEV